MARKRVMYVGGTWGNAIYFIDKEKRERIYGFKDPYHHSFAEGSVLFDLANYINEDTVPLYLIRNIDRKEDPSDMFFADITLIGNVKNPKPTTYEDDWYVEPCKELYNHYKKEAENIPFYKFKKRKENKIMVETLKGLTKDY